MAKFANKLRKTARKKNSRIILALDITKSFSRANMMDIFLSTLKLLNGVQEYISGVKIGLPTVLTMGPEAIYRLLKEYRWDLFFIADFKIADISYVNSLILERLCELGFDGAIIHSFIGLKRGLWETVLKAKELDMGVISVVAMSHPGGKNFINRNFEELMKVTMDSDIDSIVLPATYPSYIYKAREMRFDGVIMSPGIGPQGAKPGDAVKAGADFEIIGRLIYGSENPSESAEKLREVLRW